MTIQNSETRKVEEFNKVDESLTSVKSVVKARKVEEDLKC